MSLHAWSEHWAVRIAQRLHEVLPFLFIYVITLFSRNKYVLLLKMVFDVVG